MNLCHWSTQVSFFSASKFLKCAYFLTILGSSVHVGIGFLYCNVLWSIENKIKSVFLDTFQGELALKMSIFILYQSKSRSLNTLGQPN